jgi:hypothetical protein
MRAVAPVSGWREWSGLVAAPLAWAVHHQLGSDLNYADCLRGDAALVIASGSVAFLVAAAAGVISAGAWKARPAESAPRLAAILSVMASFLFGLTIALQTVAGLIIPACVR